MTKRQKAIASAAIEHEAASADAEDWNILYPPGTKAIFQFKDKPRSTHTTAGKAFVMEDSGTSHAAINMVGHAGSFLLAYCTPAPVDSKREKKNASKTKYTCADCDRNAWAKSDARLICGWCFPRAPLMTS